MVEIALDTITIIGLFISIGGLIVVIFYNALKIKQNTKSQYYQILKDLNERFWEAHEAWEGVWKKCNGLEKLNGSE